MTVISFALDPSKRELFQTLKTALKNKGYSTQEVPLDKGIGNGFFIGRSGNYADVLIIDGDIKNITTARQKPGSTKLADYETVDLAPVDFLQTMRTSGVNVPVLAIASADEELTKRSLIDAGADRFLPTKLGAQSILSAIEDLAIDSDADFSPYAGEAAPNSFDHE